MAALLLGFWLCGSLFMTLVATQNFHSVDRVIAEQAPPAAKVKAAAGAADTRALLRHMAAEQNRYFFEAWTSVQIGVAAAFLTAVIATRGSRMSKALAATLFVIALAEFWMTGAIAARTRAGLSAGPLHAVLGGVELAKLGGILAGAGRLIYAPKSRSFRRRKSDRVDYADHSHING